MSRRTGASTSTDGPVAGEHTIDSGTARLVRDRDGPRMWTLEVNGFPSSHVDLDDPAWLAFPYMHWVAELAAAHLQRHPAAGTERFLHLGGAACSLPRHFLAVRPGSRHLAVEIDARLAELVRGWFDLPRAPLLRIRVGEARAVLTQLTDSSREVVVRDVFVGQVTPPHLLSTGFVEQVRRVLAPGGIYLANSVDTRDLSVVRREVATLQSVFAHVALVSESGTLRLRRRGNVVLLASDAPLATGPELVSRLLAGGVQVRLRKGPELTAFVAGAAPLVDPPTAGSPAPADPVSEQPDRHEP